MQRCTGRYQAVGSDGNSYVVEVWTNFIPSGNFDNPGLEVPGLKSLVTSDGHRLNYVSKGEYVMVHGGIVLKSSDPDAP